MCGKKKKQAPQSIAFVGIELDGVRTYVLAKGDTFTCFCVEGKDLERPRFVEVKVTVL
jgi:hypothetical protein